MNAREEGFLLLSSQLGDAQRKPLTAAQLRPLIAALETAECFAKPRLVTAQELMLLGLDRASAERAPELLQQPGALERYIAGAGEVGCRALTRISCGYPDRLCRRMGLDAPVSLWAKGDISILDTPAVALVGSRDLRRENLEFAREAGRQAALQGLTLVSGNARGADKQAQDSCLAHGGRVISVVADRLYRHPEQERVLYLSEDGYDRDFTAARALSRNRVIHALGEVTLVAQCTLKKGGTWDGTVKNLRSGWSPVWCFDDGSQASAALETLGAQCVGLEALGCLQGGTPYRLCDV